MKKIFGFLFLSLIISIYNIQAQWVQTNGLDSISVYCFAANDKNIYAGTEGRGVYLSSNYGTNWAATNNVLSNKTVWAVAVKGKDLFAGADDGVYLSTNYGINWMRLGNNPTNIRVYCLLISDTIIFAGVQSNGIFKSTDNGESWVHLNNGLSSISVFSVAEKDTNLFAATNGGGVLNN